MNRVQQRFDRSIRDAVAATARSHAQREAARVERRQALAREALPIIETMLKTGRSSVGDRNLLSASDLDELRHRRSDCRSALGLTLDRKCRELA